MTREKAIVLLECSATELTGTLAKTTNPSAAEHLQRYIDAYDMAISALRQQYVTDKDVRKNPGWISVKGNLPQTDGIYIVCDRRHHGNPWIHTAGFRKASSLWCELHGVYYDDGYGRYRDQDKFTHWMPLPEKPEEGTV